MIEAARTADGTSPAFDFLAGLGRRPKEIPRLAAVVMRFEELSRTGTLPIPRELNELRDGIWEIKAETVRLPYFRITGPCAMEVIRVTHGFTKNTQRTPRKEIDKALWVRREDGNHA